MLSYKRQEELNCECSWELALHGQKVLFDTQIHNQVCVSHHTITKQTIYIISQNQLIINIIT